MFRLVILTIVAILAETAGIAGEESPARHTNAAMLTQMWSQQRQGAPGPIRFRRAPLHLSDIGTIAPLGMMVRDHVTPSDHMGFGPHDFTARTDRWEVLAPADGFIVTLTRSRLNLGPPSATVPAEDYLVIIEHSGTIYTWIGLINHLDPAILAAVVGEIPYGGWFPVRIPVLEGQVLGRFGGNHGIDFSVIDTDATLPGFVYPAHYDLEPWKIHVVDFFDYLDEPARSDLLRIMKRRATPTGGKIDYDVDGTLAGNWFVEGTNWIKGLPGAPVPSATHMTLGFHHIDPTKVVVSLGDFGGRQNQYWVAGNTPDPSTVTEANRVVKYELVYAGLSNGGDPFNAAQFGVQGVFLAKLLPPSAAGDTSPVAGGGSQATPSRRALVEVFPGKRGSEVTGFTGAARIYER